MVGLAWGASVSSAGVFFLIDVLSAGITVRNRPPPLVRIAFTMHVVEPISQQRVFVAVAVFAFPWWSRR